MADATDDISRRYRNQDAVYWPRTGFNSTGQPRYGDPEEIRVRWTSINEEFVDESLTRQLSNAKVLVGQDMNVGDRLRPGLIADLLPDKTPLQQPGSYDIRAFHKIPNRRARKTLRKAIL
jgi:hypothetical protein